MKYLIATTLVFCLLGHSAAQTSLPSKYKKIQKYMDRATSDKLAGVSIYINHPKYGTWTATSGYADISKNELLSADDIISLASIGKMYNAVACMLLHERGQLSVEDHIAKYLPEKITAMLPNVEEVRIKHLLSHQTGYANYEADSTVNALYTSGSLSLDTLSHQEALERYFAGKPQKFAVGERYNYSSTNYLLLAMIMDSVTGDHTKFIREELLAKNDLNNTYYRQTPNDQSIRYYADFDKDEKSDDITSMVYETTNWFMGDDGIYSTAKECGLFLEKLMNAEIVNQKTFELMQTWNDEKSPDYGYGLEVDKGIPYKLLIGHSGSGIGARADAYYFPHQKMTIVIATNSGLRGSSRGYAKAYYKMQTKIVKKLFLF